MLIVGGLNVSLLQCQNINYRLSFTSKTIVNTNAIASAQLFETENLEL